MVSNLTGFDNIFGGNKINPDDIFLLENKNIIMSMWTDEVSDCWIYTLTSDIEFLCIKENKYLVFYSKKFDLYFFYYLELDCDVNIFKEDMKLLTEKNFVHIIFSFGPCKDRMINFLSKEKINNLKYSILFTTADPFLDTRPFDLKMFKNFSYIFSSTNIIKDSNPNENDDWIELNSDKVYLDFRYSLLYYYFKMGLNYSIKNDVNLEINNRKDKFFLYSKSDDGSRNVLVKMATKSNKVYEKSFSNQDYIFSFIREDNYHIPFIIDYNICKFNLIMETNKPSKDDNEDTYEKHNIFLSEKTLKGLFVPTPAYILLMKPTYEKLKEYGFYILNFEFENGEYDFSNYERFCTWLSNCTDEEFDNMFVQAYEKSKNNKKKLEEYIYSDKINEIELLLKK